MIVLVTLVAFPSLLQRTTRANNRVSPEAPGMARLPDLLRRTRVVLVVAAVGFGVAGAFALPKIGFNSRTFDFLPLTAESVSALEILERDPVMSPMYANVTAESIPEARVMAEKLRGFKTVAGVQTATDLLPPLTDERLAALRTVLAAFPRQPDFAKLGARKTTPEELEPKVREVIDALDEIRFALNQGGQPTAAVDEAHAAFSRLQSDLKGADEAARARLAALEPEIADLLRRAFTTAKDVAERGSYAPSDLPPLLQRRFVAKDGKGIALFAIPKGDPWQPATAIPFTADVESVDPTASGLAIQTHVHEVMIIGGFRRAAAIAAGLVFLLLILDLRGLWGALFALVPTVLGWLWMLALMSALGMSFNVANIVCLPLVLGIGTAFGVHMMHRAAESAEKSGGKATLDDIVRGTGGAVIISALTTMVGFAALMLGEHGAMVSLGLSMVIGLGTCLIASVFVLPALLSLLGRAR
ncbi:MAG: MMPL family transporter [Nannocystaceae bacterium]